MSVINNVLKDLKTRESNFTPIDVASLGLEQQDRQRSNATPLLLTFVVAAMLLAGGWVYLQKNPFNAEVVAEKQPAITVQPEVVAEVAAILPEVRPQAQAVVEPNQIVGLQIRESGDSMWLEFALREKAVTYLKERGENSFAYHMRDIDSQIGAPRLTGNRWVQHLAIVSTSRGVDIKFKTMPDVLVGTSHRSVEGEEIWAIELTRPARVTVEETVNTAAIAEPARLETAAAKPIAEVVPEAQSSSEPAEPVKLEIKSTNPEADSQSDLAYAVELMKSRRNADAEKHLRELLDGNEDHKARQHLLALFQHLKYKQAHAKLAFESMERYPGDVTFTNEYARALYQQGSYRAVVDLFGKADVRDASQQSLLAASYQRLDQHENAIRYYGLALKQDAGNARNWIGLAISQEHNSELEDALSSYQTAGNIGNLNSRLQAFIEKRSNTLKKVLN